MTQNARKTRLGHRLNALYNLIPEGTELLIDLCCDHGALGRAALEEQRAKRVLFNDIHPDIMQRLSQQLTRFGASMYQLSVEPAQQLILPDTLTGTVVLAGVGDEQTIDILRALMTQPQAGNFRFIVSPATKVYFVRDYLRQSNIRCIEDVIVCENRRCYEILTLVTDHPQAIAVSQFGDQWQPDNAQHQQHLNKLIRFYSAQLKQGESAQTRRIIEGYRSRLAAEHHS